MFSLDLYLVHQTEAPCDDNLPISVYDVNKHGVCSVKFAFGTSQRTSKFRTSWV